MRITYDLPDDLFEDINVVAEPLGLTVPRFLTELAVRYAASLAVTPADPMKVLLEEIEAARRAGWRSPKTLAARKRKKHTPRVEFDQWELEAAYRAVEARVAGRKEVA